MTLKGIDVEAVDVRPTYVDGRSEHNPRVCLALVILPIGENHVLPIEIGRQAPLAIRDSRRVAQCRALRVRVQAFL